MQEKLTGGFANSVYRSISDTGETVAVSKIYQQQPGMSDPLIRLRREELALMRFTNSSLIVPQLYSTDVSRLEAQMEMLKGKQIDADTLKTLSPEERISLFHQSGALLRQVHVPINTNVNYYIASFINRTMRNVQANEPLLQHAQIEPDGIRKAVDEIRNNEQVRQSGVTRLHRDFYFANMLYNPDDPEYWRN